MSDRAEWVSLDNYAHLKMQYEDAAAERDQLRAERDRISTYLGEEQRRAHDLEADLAAAHALLREIEARNFAWRDRIATLLATAPPREETGE